MEIEQTYLNTIEAMYIEPRANIILNSEKLESFSLRSEARIFTFTIFIQHSFRSLSHSNQTRSEIKGIKIRKEEVKLSLFADNMIL